MGLYTEDGNEMNNTFTENVIICSDLHKCRWAGNDWQGESGVKEGGLFWFGMTNSAIRNRVIGNILHVNFLYFKLKYKNNCAKRLYCEIYHMYPSTC